MERLTSAFTPDMAYSKAEREAYTLLSDEDDGTPRKTSKRSRWSLCVLVILFATNTMSSLSTYLWTRRIVMRQTSMDLPGIERVYPDLDRSLSTVQFSDFHLEPSRYTAPAGDEVDRAWKELGIDDWGLIVPGAIGREVFKLDHRHHLHLPKGYFVDKEQEGFPVLVQATHDLHCLNELRKALHYNHDHYRQFHNDTKVSPAFRISHTNHCLDNIRERLMCTADVGVVPSIWVRRDRNAIQFGRKHKCHSYDAVLQWLESWGIGPNRTVYQVGGEDHIDAPPDAILHEDKGFLEQNDLLML